MTLLVPSMLPMILDLRSGISDPCRRMIYLRRLQTTPMRAHPGMFVVIFDPRYVLTAPF